MKNTARRDPRERSERGSVTPVCKYGEAYGATGFEPAIEGLGTPRPIR